MKRVRVLGLRSRPCHLLALFGGKSVYYSGHFFSKSVTECGVEKYKPALEPEAVQLCRHTSRASWIFSAEGQALVQVQRSGGVAVCSLRSDLVLSQDATLQRLRRLLNLAAPLLLSVHVGWISSSRWEGIWRLLFFRQGAPVGLCACRAWGAGSCYKVPEILTPPAEQAFHTAETAFQDSKRKRQE